MAIQKRSAIKRVLLVSLAVSGLLLTALLLTVWLGGEPPPLSIEYDGFD